jgi:nitrous oxidase accessory protein
LIKKDLAVALIALFLGIGVIPDSIGDNPSFENIIYVDDDNTDGPWDGTQEHPYNTIQDAIDQAKDADTIIVNNGIYTEYIIINKSIHLLGENRENTILKNSNDNDTIVIDNTNNVNIKNITIECSSQEKVNGIYVSQCNYCYISDNKIIAKTRQDHGITLIGSHNIVENNIITGDHFYHGIESYNRSFNIITDNNIQSCLTGIYVFLSHENKIDKNSIVNCTTGIYVEE